MAAMVEQRSGAGEADRSAVEHIRGEALLQGWPAGAMVAGTRVRVVQDERWSGPWAQVFTGTISGMGAPEENTRPGALQDELVYWVDFDEPQMDSSNDGPYRKTHIWARHLQAL